MPLNPLADAVDLSFETLKKTGRWAPILRALLAQAIAATGTATVSFIWLTAPIPTLLLLHGTLAAAAGALLGLPRWWIPINLLFVPSALWLQELELAPSWFLVGFVVLTLLFWTTYRSRVPLYLSSQEACERLAQLLPSSGGFKVLDLGCGFGGLLARVARTKPAGQYTGIEIAPLPALVAWLRARRESNCRVIRGDFWRQDLSRYDAVYAFLSPEPMTDLWRKVRAEMRPGSLFISNSFAIEGVEPDAVVPLGGLGSRALYLWRL